MTIVEIPVPGHEVVLQATDPERGFVAIIAIHDTTLGPAVGGVRMWRYRGGFAEALADVLHLSRGMTSKSALARTALGGGKAVIIGDARTQKCEALFFWFGRFVDSLQGRYITAEDVGTDLYDLDLIAKETAHVAGRSREVGGSGDPSPFTALGVQSGIEACLAAAFGSPDLKGRCVAIQGLGHVGYWLARLLHRAGARLKVADIDARRVERVCDEMRAEPVASGDILSVACDVLSPCALGGVLDPVAISRLRAPIVCGAANNQLRDPECGVLLHRRGVLYAPDYVVNAGGIINISEERAAGGYDETRAAARVRAIGQVLGEVIALAQSEDIATAQAADRLAAGILDDERRRRAPARSACAR